SGRGIVTLQRRGEIDDLPLSESVRSHRLPDYFPRRKTGHTWWTSSRKSSMQFPICLRAVRLEQHWPTPINGDVEVRVHPHRPLALAEPHEVPRLYLDIWVSSFRLPLLLTVAFKVKPKKLGDDE